MLDNFEVDVVFPEIKQAADVHKCAFYCAMEEEANELLVELDAVGLKWLSGASLLTKSNWGSYNDGLIYFVGVDGEGYVTFGDPHRISKRSKELGCRIALYKPEILDEVFEVGDFEDIL